MCRRWRFSLDWDNARCRVSGAGARVRLTMIPDQESDTSEPTFTPGMRFAIHDVRLFPGAVWRRTGASEARTSAGVSDDKGRWQARCGRCW